MLLHLSLKDFVIVKELSLDLSTGLTVLTGETGAGKSILIDALQLILGGRADSGVIREGAKQTDLTAIFEVNDEVFALLRNSALTTEDDLLEKTAIIRLVIDRNGRPVKRLPAHPHRGQRDEKRSGHPGRRRHRGVFRRFDGVEAGEGALRLRRGAGHRRGLRRV